MKNKSFQFILLTLVFLTLSACSTSNNSIKRETGPAEDIKGVEADDIKEIENETCLDCGQGGWGKMREQCDFEIFNKDAFKKCLSGFTWSDVNNNTGTAEMKDGYIKINSTEILDSPAGDTIKVIIYKQWAVDEAGNLYLLGQLG